jgi:predicted nuclease with TOPRIM domain
MNEKMDSTIDAIRQHLRILNHSSERMANSLDLLEDDVNRLTERLAKIEANQQWLKQLNIVILGSILALVLRVFSQ